MRTMKIYFKTGEVMEDVHYEIIKNLCDCMTKGSPNFQTFSDINGLVICVINVSEILYIR